MERNLTMYTDLYQLTMMQGYAQLRSDKMNQTAVFDLFYRVNPCGNGFAIAAGLEQVIEYIEQLRFTPEDIEYLSRLGLFTHDFLCLLQQFKFTGELFAVPEGTVVFPNEPLIRVKARIFEAQLLETALLTILNHQTLIATKAARIVRAAGGKSVFEFGARRAQGPDAALYGARAAWIGGAVATSNVLAGKMFNIPVIGTHAHSWVQSSPSEQEAFDMFAKTFPEQSVLLVDTYDVLRSGVPNAIETAKQLRQSGHELRAIRLDSGDLAYLSKESRKLLDAASFEQVNIVASSDLDEHVIQDLLVQGAAIDSFGVGTNLITSSDCPALGCVYKLVAEEENGKLVPKIKISEDSSKVTTPGYKRTVRLYDRVSGKAMADLIVLNEEKVAPDKPLEIFDPINTWKRRTVSHFDTRELLVPIFRSGALVYERPSLGEIQANARQELSTFWDEVKRLRNPYEYHVDLSQALWDTKEQLIRKYRRNP